MARRRTPSILTALNSALREPTPDKRDAPTVALAKRYASELDDAAVVGRAMHRALRKLSKIEEVDVELFEQIEALAYRIEEVTVAATIGPKLLAALTELQLTPAARKGVIQGGGPSVGGTKLDELRKRREGRAASVDASSS